MLYIPTLHDIESLDRELSSLPICPNCGGLGKFDDHVDTDFGPDTADIYQCEECQKWFYVRRDK